MADAKTSTTELVTQYGARLASDLERNRQEQDGVRAEIEQLQERLRALEYDHAVLATMQRALENGIPAQQAPGAAAGARRSRQQHQPTLVALIRDYLAEQPEPCSAAEIATALGEAHPDRVIKTTVVRTTLESLVARSAALRLKQGHSVFYTTLQSPR
ncbi:hypothetical protein [Streptomyces flavalbus]|uniref:Regulatory protein n=1 Tax=Streptomyces flavalbus TaxID=2665155 RepID=A0ABW2WL60_9ACTN